RVMEKEDRRRVARAFDDGRLYFVESAHWDSWGVHVTRLSVISKPAGGEIRGYDRRDDGPWLPSTPCYTGEWRGMDREVEVRRGIPIAPYHVLVGGGTVIVGERPPEPHGEPATEGES